MFYLELTTGLRRGVLAALLWGDLGLEKQAQQIRRSYERQGKGLPAQERQFSTHYLPPEGKGEAANPGAHQAPGHPSDVPLSGDGQDLQSRLPSAAA